MLTNQELGAQKLGGRASDRRFGSPPEPEDVAHPSRQRPIPTILFPSATAAGLKSETPDHAVRRLDFARIADYLVLHNDPNNESPPKRTNLQRIVSSRSKDLESFWTRKEAKETERAQELVVWTVYIRVCGLRGID
jgi:hypothetical protein